jgi:hypothetical protein
MKEGEIAEEKWRNVVMENHVAIKKVAMLKIE